MINICEMLVTDYFRLSGGVIALVGIIEPETAQALFECKAYFYIGTKLIRSINILGEDRFIRSNIMLNEKRRAVRTNEDIYKELEMAGDEKVKLIFYYE